MCAIDSAADAVVGFVCGTLTRADELTAVALATHEADGTTLCVHSVCVDASWRRRGVASALLRVYLATVAGGAPRVRMLRLLAKPYLTELYTRASFTLLGPSAVQHGAEQWLDFCRPLAPRET